MRGLAVLAATALLGCDADGALAPPDDASPGAEAAADPCAEAPVTTWANFGHGFLIGNCQGCHASTATDRHGAPLGVSFDTPAEVSRLRSAILATATGPAPTMPPAGGVSEPDRARLARWLACDPLD